MPVEDTLTLDEFFERVLAEEKHVGDQGDSEHVNGLLRAAYFGIALALHELWSHVDPGAATARQLADEGVVHVGAKAEVTELDVGHVEFCVGLDQDVFLVSCEYRV